MSISRFNPELAAPAYVGGGARKESSQLRRMARDVAVVSKKVLSRTVGARKRADMGAEDSRRTGGRPVDSRQVAELASVGSLQIEEAGLAHVLGSATAMTREFGVLLTAAWAEQARADLARALDNKNRVERVHRDG